MQVEYELIKLKLIIYRAYETFFNVNCWNYVESRDLRRNCKTLQAGGYFSEVSRDSSGECLIEMQRNGRCKASGKMQLVA
jgi:hypothetical protein